MQSEHFSPRHTGSVINESGTRGAQVMRETSRCRGPYCGVSSRLFIPQTPRPAATAACLCEKGANPRGGLGKSHW